MERHFAFRLFVKLLVATWLLATAPAVVSGAGPHAVVSPASLEKGVGINLSAVCDWCAEIQFLDVFKSARPWVNWNHPDYAFDLDANGYIRSLEPGMEAYTLVFTDLAGHYPKGRYVVLYDGEGTLRFWEDEHSRVISSEPGRIVIDLQSDHGAVFTLSEVNPDNYIRNIRMIPAEYEGVEPLPTFHPDFLARWRHVDIIRFMDWMRTNKSTVERWEDRTTPTSFTQGGPAGVSVEYMVELANELDADPWFTMPTRADDDYVRRFAEYVKEHLNPHLNVYIEWSNETWNSAFPQYHYAVEQGRKLGFTGSDWDVQIKYHAHRAKRIFEIWEDVFGSDERLVKVLGGFHHGGAYMAEMMLQHENVYEIADAYAIAPYFGHAYGAEKAEWVKTASLEEILADLEHELAVSWQATEAVIAAVEKYGLAVIAYEGGQHLVGHYYDGTWYPDDDKLTEKLTWLNRQPEMYDIYMRDLRRWDEMGGAAYVAYASLTAYNQYGSWGLFEYHGQDPATAYKFQALSDWMKFRRQQP